MSIRTVRGPLCLLIGAAASLSAIGSAEAQQASFHLDRLEIPGGPDDGLVLFRPVTKQHANVFGQFGLGYSLNPLRTATVTTDQATLARSPAGMVQHQLTTYATVGLTILDRLMFSATLPVAWMQLGQNPDYGTATIVVGQNKTTLPSISGPALGDGRLDLRFVAARGADRKWALAPQVSLFVPSGNGSSFGGDGSFGALLAVSGEYQFKPLTLVANTGVHLRARNSINDPVKGSGLGVSHEWRWAVGAFVPLMREKLRLGATIFGQTGLASDSVVGNTAFTTRNSPIEWNAEIRYILPKLDRVWIGGGAGTRILGGYGAPDFRMVGLIGTYIPIEDSKPTSPSKRVRVRTDEDKDTDGDGIPDSLDACPLEPEDGKGPDPNDGCPFRDRDKDGIPDQWDQCPDEAEDFDGIDDGDGCPEKDADGDSIPDEKDACPKEPGSPSADPKKNGCPQFVKLEQGRVRVLQQVHFKTDSDVIKVESYPILDEVVALLKVNLNIKKILVEGHTDNEGGAPYNLQLSTRRAASVMRYLLNKGVDPKRLSSNGFGLTKPVADNNTAEGRALNRRVEFKILEEDDPNKPKKPEGKSEDGGDKGEKTKEPTAESSGDKSKSAPRSQGDAKSDAPAKR